MIVLLSFGLNGQTWKYETTKKNIKVYTGPKSGSKHKQCKSVVDINTSVDEICRYLVNPDNYGSHSSRIDKLETLKKEKSSAYYYLSVGIPVPFMEDRDGAYKVQLKEKSTDAAKVTILAVPDYIEDKKGYLRVQTSNTTYDIENTEYGVRMTMYMHVEPGGAVPAWLANYFLIDSPIEICSGIRNDLESNEY